MSQIEKGNEHLWNQFCRLGEMIGDGLHLESDGKWIAQEYKKLSKILIPKEKNQKIQKARTESINSQMSELLKQKKCDCGGLIKQARSGSLVAYCESCKCRYKAKLRKRTSN